MNHKGCGVARIKHCSRIYRKELKKTTSRPEWPVEPGIPEVRIRSAVEIQLRHSVNDEEVGITEEAVMIFLKVQFVAGFENF
jgi:hypothetical protein